MLLSVSLALERKAGPETLCTIPPYGISLAHIAIFLLNIVALSTSRVSTYLDFRKTGGISDCGENVLFSYNPNVPRPPQRLLFYLNINNCENDHLC